MLQTEDGSLITNCKLSGKKQSCSYRGNILELAWRAWRACRKPRKVSVSTDGVQTKIRAKHSPVISLKLYGWKNQLRTLWEELQLKVFKNMVVRAIFGLKRDATIIDWIRLEKVT
jgi:hypothetical protein